MQYDISCFCYTGIMEKLQVGLFIAIVVVLAAIAVVSRRLKKQKESEVLPASSVPIDKNRKRPYSFESYNPEWPAKFEAIKKVVGGVFEGKAVAIEHVGSTSVPGMRAKPIIDVLVTVKRMESFVHEKRAMKALGYEWGDNYIAPGTIVFFKELPDGSKTENIHICEEGSPKALQFIYMRDYLRTHPDKAEEYGNLKVKLQEEHPHDYPAYRLGKKAFIDLIDHEAYEWKASQNKNNEPSA